MQSLQTEDPERIGDHGVLGRLGCGAMGTVFLGRSPGGRLVAVGGFWTSALSDQPPGLTPDGTVP